MKIHYILVFLFSTQIAFATSPLLDQLSEINPYWQTETFNAQLSEAAAVADMSSTDLIQLHLSLVENELRQRDTQHLNSNQQKNRTEALDILQQYWQAGIFPINNYHDYRILYFVDDANTACAVGHLIRESRFSNCNESNLEFVKDVASTMNNFYIDEIKDKRLNDWASQNGFSIRELQWIQPGYPPLYVNVSVTESSCGAATGSASVNVGPGFFFPYLPALENWHEDQIEYLWFQNNEHIETFNGSTNSSTFDQSPAGRYELQCYLPWLNWVVERSIIISDESTGSPEITYISESEWEAQDGSVSATVSEPGVYQFEWFSYDGTLLSDNETFSGIRYLNNSESSLWATAYRVFLKITDEYGCENWSRHVITYDLPCPIAIPRAVSEDELNPEGIKAASCGESDGAIYPYLLGAIDSVEWSNGSTSHELTDVPKGTYTLTIWGDSCETSTDFYLPENCADPNGINNEKLLAQSYPNPASDFLNIESSSLIKNVRLIQMNGQIALERSVNSSNSLQLQTAGLPSGLYILTVESEKGISQEKVLLN